MALTSEEKRLLEAKLKTYSPEELLSRGKRTAIEDEDYSSSFMMFRELLSKGGKMREVAKLYLSIISPELISWIKQNKDSLEKGVIEPGNVLDQLKDLSINSMISAMVNSVELYQDGFIKKDDLFTIERLIDRYPFQDTTIKNKKEFEKIYCRFKEYNLKVFLEDKK